jgi:hypothetical protein
LFFVCFLARVTDSSQTDFITAFFTTISVRKLVANATVRISSDWSLHPLLSHDTLTSARRAQSAETLFVETTVIEFDVKDIGNGRACGGFLGARETQVLCVVVVDPSGDAGAVRPQTGVTIAS